MALVQPTHNTALALPQAGAQVTHVMHSAVLSNAIGTSDPWTISDVLNISGFSKVWLEIVFAGFAAGTDLVGNVELLHGITGSTAATLSLMPLESASMLASVLPTGVTVDETNEQLDIAATFAGGESILLCITNAAPRLCCRLKRASGGDGTSSITVNAHLFQ